MTKEEIAQSLRGCGGEAKLMGGKVYTIPVIDRNGRLCGCRLPDTGVVICAGSRIPVTHCVRVYGCF